MISNDLIEQVKMDLEDDKEFIEIMEKSNDIKVDNLVVARFRGRLCVLGDENFRKSILEEAHRSNFQFPQE